MPASRKVPPFATLVVVLAAATMIALGIWQLGRRDEKEALLRRYEAVANDPSPVAWPRDTASVADSLYRRSAFDCVSVLSRETVSGTARNGAKGWAHRVRCRLPGGGEGQVALGWSRDLAKPEWVGGRVIGVIGPGPILYADPPLGGLEPLARPDPREIPNNHLAYAGQWFFFAVSALVIYALALRRRARERRAA